MSAGRCLLDRQHGLYGLQCYQQHDLKPQQGQRSGCDHLMSLLSGHAICVALRFRHDTAEQLIPGACERSPMWQHEQQKEHTAWR